MKKQKLIKSIIDYIYHDSIYLLSPNVDWYLMTVLNKHFKDNYEKIQPILYIWQERGYITLVEDEKTIFIIHPERLPTKEKLIEESRVMCGNVGNVSD